MSVPALLADANSHDLPRLLAEWSWLVPESDAPLYISVFGDWVFGAPDGSLWCLSMLDGDYSKIAHDAAEYNAKKTSDEWMDKVFLASWQEIAFRRGLAPDHGQCIGWKVHPLLGGKFEPANLQLFDLSVYESLMGQMHRHVRQSPKQARAAKQP